MKWTKALAAPFRAVGSGLKEFTMRWSGQGRSWWSLLLPRTKFDYAKEVGDGTGSSIVVAVVGWIARNFPEAPIIITREKPDGQRDRELAHPLPELIERPNPFYSGVLMWMATIVDRAATGNTYWLKIRSNAGRVVQLWWAPSFTVEPKWPLDGQTFISHYEYKPDPAREAIKIEPHDIVHFRYGIDPNNVRKGLSPLRSLLREIFTDDEAANFTASLMRNLGIPGVVIAPEGQNVGLKKEVAEEIKQDFMAKFGGDKRGEPMIMSRPTKVQVLSFSPEQMNLRDLRRVPEERVSAVFGVAAVVAGLGAGLDRSTFTNFGEAREAAYEENIIPTQRLIAADLRTQLLPDFSSDPTLRVEFDLTRVRVLQPDMDKLYERMNKAVNGGWGLVSDARRAVGLPVGPEHDVYLRPMMIVEVPVGPSAGKSFSGNGVGLKQAAAFSAHMAQVRARLAKRFEPKITKFFEGQARRVKERLAGVLKSGDGKQAFTANSLLPIIEDDLLAETLAPLYLMAMEEAWGVAAGAFGLTEGFNAGNPAILAALDAGKQRARNINGGTRRSIDEALALGTAAGYTLPQIVSGVGEEFVGITERVESYYAGRPATIALMETTWGTNRGTGAAYRHHGIELVQIEDNPACDICAPRNGVIIRIDGGMAAADMSHPNCTMTLVPIMGGS